MLARGPCRRTHAPRPSRASPALPRRRARLSSPLARTRRAASRRSVAPEANAGGRRAAAVLPTLLIRVLAVLVAAAGWVAGIASRFVRAVRADRAAARPSARRKWYARLPTPPCSKADGTCLTEPCECCEYSARGKAGCPHDSGAVWANTPHRHRCARLLRWRFRASAPRRAFTQASLCAVADPIAAVTGTRRRRLRLVPAHGRGRRRQREPR